MAFVLSVPQHWSHSSKKICHQIKSLFLLLQAKDQYQQFGALAGFVTNITDMV